MSILRPLEVSGSSNSEGFLYVGRSNTGGTPALANSANLTRLYCKPELSSTASHPCGQIDSPTSDIHFQTNDLLPKRSLSDTERQAIRRVVRQKNHNLPVLPLPSLDSVLLSEFSDSLPQCVWLFPSHKQQLSISPSHSQGSVHSPTSLSPLSISDSNGDDFLSLPILQSAPLKNSMSHENFAQMHSFLPNLKTSDAQNLPLGGNAKLVEDQEGIRHKLQELERELLSDNDDSSIASVISPEQSSHLDQEWVVDTMQTLLSDNSVLSTPTISHPCIKKENPTSQTCRPHQENQKQPFMLQIEHKISPVQAQIDQGSPLKHLVECATSISEAKPERALPIIRRLRKNSSVDGDPMQRLIAYMVESLVARSGSSTQGSYNSLRLKETSSSDHLSAAQLLFEVCPYINCGLMAANSTILEAFETEEKVHIIDFEIKQGSQYVTLIHALAARTGGPPKVRMTVVDDPESTSHAVGSLHVVEEGLEKLANAVGVNLQFHIILAKTADVQPLMLECQPDEAVAVNFAFQLHHIPDESVSTKNPRDQLLRMVKSLNPKVVTIVENEINTNTSPFMPRFMEALNYYSAVFESLDIHLARESKERFNIEKHFFARNIVNIIACEGAERTERFEVAGKWKARMMMAGFTVYPLSSNVDKCVRNLYESCGARYKLKRENGALHFAWQDKVLTVASAWH
ncbi:hypothetical protein SUGI_0829600 [Cryptomeria japonica]|uniref:scarecrow-like protein 21 n=1 Tax=Cryptomeria japonica TaxID=3369 RepID=UPI002414B318|nr:scarecrow-like protein 21 [Cryptomeria japonica]XP_057854891.2 scarecrow-like protein 21 [Cryptomeria japonica]XP_057854892.2 scarecrow-like protein 21 [Cryptomeria japonica]XP_059065583.1 scarecrow-like protein 21 [Cryptomeria japonica]GLJ40348.1 hypothetical protein SUGI_0829600 [Cryptomeria japonica]